MILIKFINSVVRSILPIFIASLMINLSSLTSYSHSDQILAQQVEITRTDYGVPHILGENLEAAAFGLAWCEIEDYGERVIKPLISARGDLALIDGYEAIDGDFVRQLGYEKARAMYGSLDKNTRSLLEGFASGVNYYLEQNHDLYPQYQGWKFTGVDVAAVTTNVLTTYNGARWKRQLIQQKAERDSMKLTEAGSNAWAFAPSRTKDGNAILVRNPHLSWSAGYYEAHITVPDTLNYYGDFRIGGLFAIIGGFNERLGWATTNNNPDGEEIYAFKADTLHMDHFIIDDISVPLSRRMLRAEFKNGNAISSETREFFFTPYGPVIHRDEGMIYVLRQVGNGEYRRGDQFTRMMLAQNLEEWKEAMRMQAITSSNYTYADADGNIFYVWNGGSPILNHDSGGDSTTILITTTDQIWNDIVPFDELPQLLNPVGGYLHNENDPFHFTNLNEILHPEDFPSNMPEPRLRQRSQHSLQLIHNDDILTLEEVVKRKHSMSMLVADQIKDDLLSILESSTLKDSITDMIRHLEDWDNSVDARSEGGVLFQEWFTLYSSEMAGKELYETPWSFDDPMSTPDGIADHKMAVSAFAKAINNLNNKYGTWNLKWGDVHRLRLGNLDLPVSGGPGGLGCFRVLWYSDAEDGKRKIRGGDGWQLAVEFSDPPKAYSILAYGQSNDPDSPHHTDQAMLFANNEMKKVAFTPEQIEKATIKKYRPGQ